MRTPPLNSGDRLPVNQPQGFGNPHQPLLARKAAQASSSACDIAVTVILPWIIFTLLVSLLAFALEDYEPLVWTLLATCALLAFLFIAMGCSSGRAWHLAMGFLILASVGVAVPVGLFIESGYMDEYWRLDSGAQYHHVSPLDPGSSHSDATILDFEAGSSVDAGRSLGYMKLGTVYCVAPISGSTRSASIQYWASGVNCCEQRGAFACGDIDSSLARGGIVRADGRGDWRDAVRMAESVYEIMPNGSPIIIEWNSDVVGYKERLWTSAASLVTVASIIHLLVSCMAGFFLSKYLQK